LRAKTAQLFAGREKVPHEDIAAMRTDITSLSADASQVAEASLEEKSNLATTLEGLSRPMQDIARLAALNPSAGVTRSITLVSLCTASEEPRVCEASRSNLRAYADAQGYGARLFSDVPGISIISRRKPTWYKLPLLLSVLNTTGVDYAIWIEPNALIMNMSLPLPLASMLPGETQIAFTARGGPGGKGWAGWADRCFMTPKPLALRSGPLANDFLQETWDAYPPPMSTSLHDERAAMAFVLGKERDKCRTRLDMETCCRSSKTVNDTKYTHAKLTGRGWQGDLMSGSELYEPGDFMLHFSLAGEAQAAAMQKFSRLAEASATKEYAKRFARR
jgi:hypothetical protein